MLERFFLKPQTVDRIMGCWLGQKIELYAAALYETGYSARSILRRVPILVQFADFTDARQIQDLAQAESVIEPFVDYWMSSHLRYAGPVPTPYAMPVCNAWWTAASRSRRSAIT